MTTLKSKIALSTSSPEPLTVSSHGFFSLIFASFVKLELHPGSLSRHTPLISPSGTSQHWSLVSFACAYLVHVNISNSVNVL